jgi:hypothetical protein
MATDKPNSSGSEGLKEDHERFLEKKKEVANKQIEDANLKDETILVLEEEMDKQPSQTFFENLEAVLEQLRTVEKLMGDLDEATGKKLLEKYNESYERGNWRELPPKDFKEILIDWRDARAARIIESTELAIKKAFAHIYLRDKDGARLEINKYNILSGTYTIDFGDRNTMEDKYVGLADIFEKNPSITSVVVIKPNGERIEGQRNEEDNKFYRKDNGVYLAVRHGDTIEATDEIQAKHTMSEEEILADVQFDEELKTPSRVAEELPVSGPIYTEVAGVQGGVIPRLSEESKREVFTMISRSTMPEMLILMSAIGAGETTSSSPASLYGREVFVPEELLEADGEKADDVVKRLHEDVNYASTIHDALSELAIVRSLVDDESTSVSRLWLDLTRKRHHDRNKPGGSSYDLARTEFEEEERGGLKITIDEISRAVYGVSSKKLLIGKKSYLTMWKSDPDKYKWELHLFGQFKEATETLFRYLGVEGGLGTNSDMRRMLDQAEALKGDSLEEDAGITPLYNMLYGVLGISTTDTTPNYDYRTYGRKRQLAGADEMNMDNYQMFIARSNLPRFKTGSGDILRGVSEASAFQQLLFAGMKFEEGKAVPDLKALAKQMNLLANMGYQREKTTPQSRKVVREVMKDKEVDPAGFDEITPEFLEELMEDPSKGLPFLFREYMLAGIAVENSMQLAADQEITSAFILEQYGPLAAEIIESIQETEAKVEFSNKELLDIAERVDQQVVGGILWMIDNLGQKLSEQDFRIAFGAGIPLAPRKKKKSPFMDVELFTGPDGSPQMKFVVTGVSAGINKLYESDPIDIGAHLGAHAGIGGVGVSGGVEGDIHLGKKIGPEGQKRSENDLTIRLGGAASIGPTHLKAVLAATVGGKRDLGVTAALRAQKFVEEMREAKKFDELENILATVEEMLPDNLNENQVRAMRNGAIEFIEQLISKYGVDVLKEIVVPQGGGGVSVGFSGGFDVEGEGGLEEPTIGVKVGAYVVVAARTRKMVLFGHPPVDIDETAQEKYELEMDRLQGLGEFKAITIPADERPEIDPRVEETDTYLAELEVKAGKLAKKVIEGHNANIGKAGLRLERQGDLIRLIPEGADGFVHLWIDPDCDIESFSDGQNIDLSLQSTDNFRPIVVSKQYPVAMGGATNHMEIIITNKKDADIEAIKAKSQSHYQWYQKLDGQKTDIVEVKDRLADEDDPESVMDYIDIMNPEERRGLMEAALRQGEEEGLTKEELKGIKREFLSDMSTDNLRLMIKKMNMTLETVNSERYERALFLEISEDRQTDLANFAKTAFTKPQAKALYRELEIATARYDDNRIDKLIDEKYAKFDITALPGTDPVRNARLSEEERVFVRQILMQAGRPEHGDEPPKFNEHAFKHLMEDYLPEGTDRKLVESATKLAMAYFKEGWKRYKENPEANAEWKGAFSEGSKLFIHVSRKPDIHFVQGYYKEKKLDGTNLHGPIFGSIEWDANDPEETLAQMGIDSPTQEQKETVAAIANTILNMTKPDVPFKNKEEATFDEALYTMTGENVLFYAEEIFGKEMADRLLVAATNPKGLGQQEEYKAAVDQFVGVVADLYLTGKAEIVTTDGEGGSATMTVELKNVVHSGLYEACYNLAHSRTEELVFSGQKYVPENETDTVKSSAVRVNARDYIETRLVSKYAGLLINFSTGMPWKEKGQLSQPDQEGTGDEEGIDGSPQDLVGKNPGGGETNTADDSPRG